MTKPRLGAINPIELSGDTPEIPQRDALNARGLTGATISRHTSVLDAEVQSAARVKLSLGAGRVVAVTGMAEDDGAAPLASRLGAALAAMESAPVLLIDGNVSRSTPSDSLGLASKPGLLEVLQSSIDLDSAVYTPPGSNLAILPLGKADTSLAALLAGPNGSATLAELRRRYRYVVLEVGLIQRAPDALLLAAMSDGVVVAAAAGARRRHELLGLKQDLDRLKIPLLGVILTSGAGRSGE